MKRLRKSIELMRFNLGPVLLYEVLTKVLFYALMVPVLYASLNTSIRVAGIDYLSKGTVKKYFMSPYTYLFAFFVLIILSMCILINISGVLYAMKKSYRREKSSPLKMLLFGIKSSFRIIKVKNLPIVIYILFVLPISCLTLISTSILKMDVPDYILIFLTGEKNKIIILVAILLIISMIAVSFIYTINYFVLKKKSFSDSVRSSRNCLKITGNVTIVIVLFLNILFFVLEILFGEVASRLLIKAISGFLKQGIGYSLAETVIKTVSTVIYLMFSIVAMPFTYAYISEGYFEVEDIGRSNTASRKDDDVEARKAIMKERAIILLILLIAVVLDISYFALSQSKVIGINAEYMSKATITAHRGASKDAPENTLPAFEEAINQGADVVELDVRETLDGYIVVMHDSSLKRTIGVKKNVEDITYEELMTYDAGVLFGEKFRGTKVPTLEEVIELVDGRCKLNIELKPAESNTDFVEKVVDIIEKYNLNDQCVLTSPDYKVISKVKAIDNDITTIYVMSVAVGEFYTLEYADGFSIKYKYITNDVVKNVHKRGKEIYAWTIDDENIVEEVLLKGVDSVITNKPAEMKDYVGSFTDSIFEKLVKKYFEIGL